MSVPHNKYFCFINVIVWISIGVIELIGLGLHVDPKIHRMRLFKASCRHFHGCL